MPFMPSGCQWAGWWYMAAVTDVGSLANGFHESWVPRCGSAGRGRYHFVGQVAAGFLGEWGRGRRAGCSVPAR